MQIYPRICALECTCFSHAGEAENRLKKGPENDRRGWPPPVRDGMHYVQNTFKSTSWHKAFVAAMMQNSWDKVACPWEKFVLALRWTVASLRRPKTSRSAAGQSSAVADQSCPRQLVGRLEPTCGSRDASLRPQRGALGSPCATHFLLRWPLGSLRIRDEDKP